MDAAPLLHELCAKLGICPPQAELDALTANPPADVDAFAAAVLRADGGDRRRPAGASGADHGRGAPA